MAKIVNLHRVRKRIARSKAEHEAQTRRAQFGRTLAEQVRDEKLAERSKASVEAHRLTNRDEP